MRKGVLMAFNRKIARLTVFSLSILMCLALGATAFAQSASLGEVDIDSDGDCEEDFTIPPGTDAGFYDVEVTGSVIVDSDYPPAGASVSTDANVLFAGESFTLFCQGFEPNTEADVDLELVQLTEATFSLAQTTETRTVRTRIRVIDRDDFDDDDDFFRIIEDADGDRTIVVNSSSSASSSAAAAASGGGDDDGGETRVVVVEQRAQGTTRQPSGVLARTGMDALPVAAAAMATILLGTVLLGAARRREQTDS